MKNSIKLLNIILPSVLLLLCICIYFININNYPFIDTDETKFVSMAKEMLNYNDWVNIRLNGENVYNYSPLYFWITNISCLVFGKITETSVRLPISCCACIGILCLFFAVKNILQRTYAFLIALIFALCLGVIIFSRLSTLDLLSSFLMIQTILAVYILIFTKNIKYRTMIWSYILFFLSVSVLSAGILGFLIPAVSTVMMLIFSGKTKELIKIKYLIPGIIIFIILLMPWHIIMLHKHGFLFIKEYLQPILIIKNWGFKDGLYVLGVFLLGFLPWSFSFLWVLGSRFKGILNSFISYFKENSEDKLREKWNKLRQIEKFLSLNTILFFTTLIFAIIYGKEFTFLILFLMFPAACISGHYWYEYIVKKKHDKSIFFSTLIPDVTLIVISLIGLFGHNVLNQWLFKGLNHLFIPLIIIFFVIPLIGIFAVILKGRLIVFISNVILMISLSFIIAPSIFNFISINGGENDLISYAQIAHKDKVVLAAFIPSKKYSLVYYYDNYVKFFNNKDLEGLKQYLINNPKDYVAVEIKDLWDIEEKGIKYMLLDAGKRYCLIQHMDYETEKLEDKTEPEVILY